MCVFLIISRALWQGATPSRNTKRVTFHLRQFGLVQKSRESRSPAVQISGRVHHSALATRLEFANISAGRRDEGLSEIEDGEKIFQAFCIIFSFHTLEKELSPVSHSHIAAFMPSIIMK